MKQHQNTINKKKIDLQLPYCTVTLHLHVNVQVIVHISCTESKIVNFHCRNISI